jgi:quercetin dioxygenase-like cupin family protein
VPELETAHLDNCTVYNLPGRDWFYLLGPQNSETRNLTFGLAEFPPGTLAGAHTHGTQEEILYVLSGQGAIIAGQHEERMAPGVAVFIPPGLEHQIRVDGQEPLTVVTVFSPPVVPGAYDSAQGQGTR